MPLKKSFYLTDDVLEKLDKIANQNKLLTADGKPHYTKTLRYILANIDPDAVQSPSSFSDELRAIRKMVEQINVAVPHLLYNTTFSYKINEGTLSDPKFIEFKAYTLKNVAGVCGQIQQQTYQHIYAGHDSKNMKTIPIEEDKNVWK